MASEIIEEKEEESPYTIDAKAQELNIRRIIKYQKSLYYSCSSSSSFSSAAGSRSSFSSPRKSRSLLDLMKEGSTSLRRLFEMEHTSLKNYLKDYSGSPMIKPIFLWGSDTDHDDPWLSIKQAIAMASMTDHDYRSNLAQSGMALEDHKFPRMGKRRLTRTRSFRRLPRFRVWFICRGFRFRLRLFRRLRVMICGRKF
ncbi:hypothetical protein M9H77_22886 [Catharanthus roseus]|uniref:Uncharacterized protein n=1 Tax=Catharanthus roseus TaxID=4058 RepID=A0ACC0AVS7_CATRO|nr:hypothetical protein M9H77_22886 [Catharanthus roseus]